MDFGGNMCSPIYNRKKLRKSARRARKARHAAFILQRNARNITVEHDLKESVGEKVRVAKLTKTCAKNVRNGAKRRRRKDRQECSKSDVVITHQEFSLGSKQDDEEIYRYEKMLGYKKRKGSGVPRAFKDDGLDYLLELCDSPKSKDHTNRLQEITKSDDLLESYSDNEVQGEGFSQPPASGKILNDSMQSESDESNTSFHDHSSSAQDEEDKSEIIENDRRSKLEISKEDIYGRSIDPKTGMLVTKLSGAREKLEKLEQEMGNLQSEGSKHVRKSLRSIINRLNENTLVSSVKSVDKIYATNAQSDVKKFLYTELKTSITTGYLLQHIILNEYAIFVALLHSMVSSQITSYLVENFVLELSKMIPNPPEGKSIENLCIFFAELYNFKVIKAEMLIDIIRMLRLDISAKTLECVKLIFSHSGARMKSRDSELLQKCIIDTQTHLTKISPEQLQMQHLRFVVEELISLKNANIKEFIDSVDDSLHDHYIKKLQGMTRGLEKESELGMTVDDIIHAEERGRWWLVGSSWLASASTKPSTDKKPESNNTNFSDPLLKLAKSARMNTVVRRNIFCTIMSSEDEMDAFEKLMRLSLKGQQEREILHILVHCVMKETIYNPFYGVLISTFCCFHKRFKLTTQFAIWDRVKNLMEMKSWQRSHLGSLIADLLLKRSIGITVLKVVEFATIDKLQTEFVQKILEQLLDKATQQNVASIFKNVIESPAHKLFSQGLQIFIHLTLKKMQISNKRIAANLEYLDSLWKD